jgi:hypothetical protein
VFKDTAPGSIERDFQASALKSTWNSQCFWQPRGELNDEDRYDRIGIHARSVARVRRYRESTENIV